MRRMKMKLAPEAFAEVLDIVREAVESILTDQHDVSVRIKDLDLEVVDGKIQLAPGLLTKYGK
jgi:plasmid maintenance system antidote protein VapI